MGLLSLGGSCALCNGVSVGRLANLGSCCGPSSFCSDWYEIGLSVGTVSDTNLASGFPQLALWPLDSILPVNMFEDENLVMFSLPVSIGATGGHHK